MNFKTLHMIGAEVSNIIPIDQQVSTEWETHNTMSNGSPTYGRRFYVQVATVKKDKSGKWYFITCIGTDIADPTGPYASAEEAKEAFDCLRY